MTEKLTQDQFFNDVKSGKCFSFFDTGFVAGEGTWKSAIVPEMVARYGVTNVKARNFILDMSNEGYLLLNNQPDGEGGRDTWVSLTDRAILRYTIDERRAKQTKELKKAAKADVRASVHRSHANCDHAVTGAEGKKARALCRKERASK